MVVVGAGDSVVVVLGGAGGSVDPVEAAPATDRT
jgi:hypothetical protein